MIFTAEELNQIQTSFKIDSTFYNDWMGSGMGYVADLNFNTKVIERLCNQSTSCKDYLKVAALAAHTNKSWQGADAPKTPYHFKYTSWCRMETYNAIDISIMNKLEAKWGVSPTQHLIICDKNKRFDLFIGDPIWMKSVELLATFIMLCRNSFLDNVMSGSDVKAFMLHIYPKLDTLEELCQYGVVNLNWNKLGPTKDQLANSAEINGTLHNLIGPYAIANNYTKDAGVYLPEKTYYEYFKSKATPIPFPTLEKVSF